MVTLRIFGEPCLLVGSREVKLRNKEALLLAYLSEQPEGRYPHREDAAACLWPEVEPYRALRSLTQLMHQLRQKAPELSLQSHTPTVVHAAFDSDVRQLRHLVRDGKYQAALSLFRGFPRLDRDQVGESADFVARINADVRHCLAVALESAATAATTVSDRTTVKRVAESLLSDGRLEVEALKAQLAVFVAEGDRDGASRCLASLRSNGYPDLSLSDLHQLALRQQPGIAATRQVRLIGRQDEIGRLNDALSNALSGTAQVVLLEGEPGIGKTRLAEHFVKRVLVSGTRAWSMSCTESQRRVPFAPIQQLWQDYLATFFLRHGHAPEYAEVQSSLTQLARASELSEHERWKIHNALIELLLTISSSSPLVLLVDDVQWADESTAQLLNVLSLRASEHRLLMLLTVRKQDSEAEPLWVRHELTITTVISLGELSTAAAGELIEAFEQANSYEIQEDQKRRVLWQSAGRPLLILETLMSLVSEPESATASVVHLPATAEALLRRRLRNLSSEAAWVAGLLAVISRPLSISQLPEASGLADSVVAAALEVLCNRGVLQFAGGQVEYAHDLMREAAYRQLPGTTKALLHRRAAELLSESEEDGIVAAHWAAAGDSRMAGQCGLRAAETAKLAGRSTDCMYYYELVLNHGCTDTRAAAARKYAAYLAQLGRVRELTELLDALPMDSTAPETRLLAEAVGLERALGRGETAIDELVDRARAIVALAECYEAADVALALGTLFDIAFDTTNLEFGMRAAEAMCTAADRSANPVFRSQVLLLVAVWESVTKGIDQGKQRLIQARTNESDPHTKTLAAFAHGTVCLFGGELIDARSHLDEAIELADATGDIRRSTSSRLNAALVSMELGDFDTARRHMEFGLASPNLGNRLRAYANLAILHLEESAYSQASNALQTLEKACRSYGSKRYSTTAAAVGGLVALASQQIEPARAHYQALSNDGGPDGFLAGDLSYTVPFAVEMMIRDESHSAARQLIRRARALVAGRDILCGLRLDLAEARVELATNTGKAPVLASRVLRQARERSAELLVKQARVFLAVADR